MNSHCDAAPRLGALMGALLASAAVPTAYAQTDDAGLVLTEVVVTAERRSENMQAVPISIDVQTAADLDRAGIESGYDLQSAVPGLVISNVIGYGQPAIRGIGNKNLSAAADSSTTVHVDGVYLSRPGQVLSQYFDIARLEVLKGPQGTLYGRNTVGGTINIVHNAPAPEFAANVDVTIGNFQKRRARAMVNVPLTDSLFLRISVLQSNRDGYTRAYLVDNSSTAVPNTLGKGPSRLNTVDNEDYFGVRSALRWMPHENVTATMVADYALDNSNRSNVYFLQTDVANTVGAGPDKRRLVCPGLLSGTNPTNTCTLNPNAGDPDDRVQYLNETPVSRVEEKGLSATIEWNLGNVDLKSITSYRSSRSDMTHDVDATNVAQSRQRIFNGADTFLQEVQLLSKSSQRLQWVAGVFYLDDQYDQDFLFRYFYDEFRLGLASTGSTQAHAAFGQGSYQLTDRLTLTVGGRYSEEKKNVHLRHSFLPPGGQQAGGRWSAFTPKYGVDFQLNPQTLLYVSASKGFKSGGLNTLGAGAQLTYDPESIWAYEAGVKTTVADGRLRVNAAAYYYDYTDLQVNQVVNSVEVIDNAASAEVSGADLDINWLPTDWLKLRINAAYLDAKFRSYLSVDTNSFNPNVQNLSGNRLERAPKLSVQTTVDVYQKLANGSKLNWQVNYSHTGRMYFTPFNKPFLEQEAYGLLGAAVSWNSEDDRWTVALTGRNLTDKTYKVNTIDNSNTIGALSWLGAPREYGVRVGYSFQ